MFTDGDYRDLLPEHPWVWAYQRYADGKTLTVLANLSEQSQPLSLQVEGNMLMNNYADFSHDKLRVTLLPYQAVYLLSLA